MKIRKTEDRASNYDENCMIIAMNGDRVQTIIALDKHAMYGAQGQ
ncbi:hypothetical protein EZS27_040084 [termite gut metagenome]|uniref:Uncharacterized protein n=1 Tax=termite gut metagenome TaxID=433724 RepID=A0A5J4PFK6_9ZZZZ